MYFWKVLDNDNEKSHNTLMNPDSKTQINTFRFQIWCPQPNYVVPSQHVLTLNRTLIVRCLPFYQIYHGSLSDGL